VDADRLVRERDDVVVELQWLVRELRHEVASLRVELALARDADLWAGEGVTRQIAG
jgi:hypothetical protein